MSGSVIVQPSRAEAPVVARADHAAALPATRLLIAAAHELARSGLGVMAAAQPDMIVACELDDPGALELAFERERPDAVLIDFDTSECREAAARLLTRWPDAVVIAVGHHDGDEEIRHA